MAQTVSLLLSARDRADLQRIIDDRSRPVKHIQRARIVLLSADRLPVLEIATRVGISRPMVWRWQRRYADEGVDGLLRDKTRPPGTPNSFDNRTPSWQEAQVFFTSWNDRALGGQMQVTDNFGNVQAIDF